MGKQSQKQADGKNHCLQNVTKVKKKSKKVVTKYFQKQLDILRTIASNDYQHRQMPRVDYAEMYLENLSFLIFGKCPSRQKETVHNTFSLLFVINILLTGNLAKKFG